MLRRVLTAIVLIPAVVALVWWGPSGIVTTALGLVLLLALREYFYLGEQMNLHGFPVWTGVSCVLLLFAQWAAGKSDVRGLEYGAELIRNRPLWAISAESVFVLFAFGCVAIVITSRMSLSDILPGAGLSAGGLLLVVWPASYLVRLDQMKPTGPVWVLFVLVLVWAGDMAAYFTGKAVGHTPFAPVLSPKKTWEGAAGNIAASLIVAYFFARPLMVEASTLMAAGLAASIAGQCGDLLESAYKRGARVKDSSGLLPGHGGMLDRVDSLIYAAPVVWYYVEWVVRRRG